MRRYLTLVFMLIGQLVVGQELVTFYGVVLNHEKLEPIDGAYIYNLNSAKESITDSLGFFSIKGVQGDTLIFRDVRYLPSTMIIPDVLSEEGYGLIQLLKPSVRMLEEVSIYSLPTQEEFVRMFLEIETPKTFDDRTREMQKELMDLVKESYPSERYYYEIWADRKLYELTGKVPLNHFLDPFRWTEFIRSFKQKNTTK